MCLAKNASVDDINTYYTQGFAHEKTLKVELTLSKERARLLRTQLTHARAEYNIKLLERGSIPARAALVAACNRRRIESWSNTPENISCIQPVEANYALSRAEMKTWNSVSSYDRAPNWRQRMIVRKLRTNVREERWETVYPKVGMRKGRGRTTATKSDIESGDRKRRSVTRTSGSLVLRRSPI
jgi:hypothetical protein